jgi:hypothetical protein
VIKLPRAGLALTLTLTASTLALSPALAAPATAKPGWHIAFSQRYGGGEDGSVYWDVAVAGTSAGWAVGSVGTDPSRPVAAHWNGRSWRRTAMPPGLSSYLIAVSADSPQDAWAVSGLGGYVLHWQGTGWSVAKRWPERGLPTELTGVTAFSPTNVWVFGGSGAWPGVGTWHLQGRTWTKVTGAGGNISFASAVSPTDIWAIGGIMAGQDAIMHYSDGHWRHVTAAALDGLQFSGITTMGQGQVLAAAALQTNVFKGYLVQLSGGKWRRIAVPWPANLIKIGPDGKGGIWLTAQNRTYGEYLIHRSARGRWYRIPLRQRGTMFGLAQIGTSTSLLGAGAVVGKPGSDAAVWAYGPVS